jgi:phosphoserine phosphatase RsbU/P
MIRFTIRNRGIAFRFSLSILTITILIFALSFIVNHNISKKIILRNVEKNVENLTISTANKIESVIKSVQKIPENQSSLLQNFHFSADELRKLLMLSLETNPEIFGSCIAYKPYGFYQDSLYFESYYYRLGDSLRFENLGSDLYQYFFLDWYQIPKELEKAFWSEPYYDEGGGNILMCTYSVPFFKKTDGKDEFLGIITVDISLKWLEKLMSKIKLFDKGYAFLLSGNGTLITHPDENLILNQTIFSIAEERNLPKLREIGRDMIKGNSNFVSYTSVVSGNEGWLFYAPLKSNGWSIGVVIPSDELFADLYSLNRKLLILGSIGIILLLILIIFISLRLTKPITKLAKITQTIGAGNFNANTKVSHGGKEIVQLGNSINQMQLELKNYIKNLKEATAAKEKIESELKIAHDIQQGIIPKIFPPFPEREDIDLYAVLNPARDVGGDLYDFFFIDDYKICFAIGDVSGKGVPASLFMAITRTLLRSKATKNSSAKKIVNEMNIELCQGNENSMFVTFFLCIMDTKTGIVEFCNAGHNYPYIIRKDNKIECLEETHGIPIGIFEDINYKSGTFQLLKNESLVLYTDGITEAMNIENNLYGDERLINLLYKSKDHHPDIITKTIVNDVNKFVGEAEQSDDITILLLTYFLYEKTKHSDRQMKKLVIKNNVSELEKVNIFVEKIASEWKIPNNIIFNINLVLEEIVSNIIFYAFDDISEHEILIEAKLFNNELQILIEDDGKAFNLLEAPAPTDLDASIEDRNIGGLGIHFAKTLMDNIDYKRENNKNKTYLRKTIHEV